jgi:protein tyrosine phosphatase
MRRLSRLHGHNKLKEFILSQHPLESIREDFWRMLWDHNAQTVVLLSSINEEVRTLIIFIYLLLLLLLRKEIH